MGAAKAFDGEPGVGAADNGTDGADENVHEKMDFVIIVAAEVRTIAITVQQVLERVAQLDGKRLGLVGHDPQMTGLVAALSGQPPERLRFPKGAVVRFDVNDLLKRQAQARWWLAPREKEAEEGLPIRGEGDD